MLQIMRKSEAISHRRGTFELQIIKPGKILKGHQEDLAFGPLSRIDHAHLGIGTVVPMHEHRNDEIFSYMWDGEMVHKDSTGDTTTLSPHLLMLMNAGNSFFHEESVPKKQVEMLQVFIRPEEKDLAPQVQFYDRPVIYRNEIWELLCGPEGTKAPLKIRQDIMIFDAHPLAGEKLEIPESPGMVPWVYIMDGAVTIGDTDLNKGDAITDLEKSLSTLQAKTNSTIVAFLVNLSAKATLEGLFSGYRK
ncbi:hypothetical protein COE67_18705 [Priestia megaterium]|uniref:pirin family protein n=1 Tax=Priestia megaterium TaxID=1404 RepID=UPI000411E2DF|nr:pirin family protein [Priestia megaterium]MCU7766826.1 pirin family protein [Priestia megaterium]MDH6657021.1 redox-sensitive bicupin YhaK (pirin superfamily) [Bacillus sp. PvP124]PFP04325.1 hypothetical protein COJ90_29195 [Priestia megaterium]PGX37055.1 hypothetical protein COE67_18705 [Priestia megaterium]